MDAHAYGTCPSFRENKIIIIIIIIIIKLKKDAKTNWSVKTLLHMLSILGYGLLMYLS